MKRICLFGGTFDPPHNGHLSIAKEVIDSLHLDEVWFIPTYEPPLKDRFVTSSKHRLQMLKRMIEGREHFRIETIEIERKGKSYTIDTVQTLQKRYPKVKFYFLIGADQVNQLKKWHRIDELVKIIQFIGVERPGYPWKDVDVVHKISAPKIDISSTQIRHLLTHGKEIKKFVPERVYAYIKEHQLYGYRRNETDC